MAKTRVFKDGELVEEYGEDTPEEVETRKRKKRIRDKAKKETWSLKDCREAIQDLYRELGLS